MAGEHQPVALPASRTSVKRSSGPAAGIEPLARSAASNSSQPCARASPRQGRQVDLPPRQLDAARDHLHRPLQPSWRIDGPQVGVPVAAAPAAAQRSRSGIEQALECQDELHGVTSGAGASYRAWNSSPSCSGDSGRTSSSAG